jgi:hypothetical protein
MVLKAAITPEQAAKLPPAANHQVDFSKEIKPIFEASCIKCHGRGKDKGGLRLDTRETLLKGGDSGLAVIPGKSAESLLIALVQGFDADSIMPKKGSRLTPEQIGLLRAWIDQGLRWDAGVTFGRLEPANLKPHLPAIPSGSSKANPIDRFLKPYFVEHHIKPPPLVTDRIFARRVYLDIIGLLPPPDELAAFVADKHANKRERLVRKLLADDRNYAEHWLSFWNDLLRNDYKGTGYIDGGRKQITPWLYSALLTNMPYNEFVAKLVNPTPESEGFTKGIVWRGVVNASQTPQMQAAQHISQVFMGVNLKCASCHDSFVNDLTLADAYGLAGIYADGPLEMVRCDKPIGKKAELKFIYPELGAIDPDADKPARLKRLAEIITQRQDARLTGTFVNRLWQKFMGGGLVEPVDDMEKTAWAPDILDWLAEDFANHRYNIRHTMEVILTSDAYQLPSACTDEQNQSSYVFQGPSVRRMTSEQFCDALYAITGMGGALPASGYDFLTVYTPAQPRRISEFELSRSAKWIWNDPGAAHKTKPGVVYFRKEFVLREKPSEAAAIVSCDDSFTLYVNGERVASGDQLIKPRLIDLVPWLKAGSNVFAIAAENKEPEAKKKPNGKKAVTNAPPVDSKTPAGLFVIAHVNERITAEGMPMEVAAEFSSDASWLCTTQKVEGWETREFVRTNWASAFELGGVRQAPWNLGPQVAICESAVAQYGNFRACLVNASPLAVALGRPNREQVVTTRPMAATTLQALELTNGPELAEMVRRGAEKMVEVSHIVSDHEWLRALFVRAIGRNPTNYEIEIARDIIGHPAEAAGVEDLLWTLAMLPEFQLIY